MPITLPSPDSKQPATRKSPGLMVIYGSPKCGKTTAISQLPGCLDIDLEDGADFLEMLKVKVNTYAELLELAKSVREANYPYKYIAIDTVTRLEEWAEVVATTKYKASPIGKNFTGASVLELPNGGGYLHLRNAFIEAVQLCRRLAHHTIFVCHLKDKLLGGADAKAGTTVSAKDLELTGKCKQILCSIADAIGYIYRTADNSGNSTLNISFKSSEMVNCGSRCEHLRGVDIPLDWKKIFVD